MKKREALLILTTIAVLGLSGCGAKETTQELALVSDRVEIELGSELDTTVTNYVTLDENMVNDTAVDFSEVDVMTVGTYTATVIYTPSTEDTSSVGDVQTLTFEVVVSDTTAPEVTLNEDITAVAGYPLSVTDIVNDVTELTDVVTVSFGDAVYNADNEESVETAETEEDAESTEAVEATEVVEAEYVSMVSIGSVTMNDIALCYAEAGTYPNSLTVVDESGNKTTVNFEVNVVIAGAIEGLDDIKVTVGNEVDYMDGVTATSCMGKDITDRIVVDDSKVNLDKAGTYEATYTVEDDFGIVLEGTRTVKVVEKTTASSSGSSSTSSTTTATTVTNSNTTTTNSSATTSTATTQTQTQNTTANTSTSTSTGSTSTSTGSTSTSTGGSTSSSSASTPATDSGNTNASTGDTSTGSTDSADTSTSTPSTDTTTSTDTSTSTTDTSNSTAGSSNSLGTVGGAGTTWEDSNEAGNIIEWE